MEVFARPARAVAYLLYVGGSAARLMWLRLKFPSLEVRGRVRIGRNCDIYAGRGSQLILDGCVLGAGVRIATAPGARLWLAADVVGPNSVVVARETIEIRPGSKLAEMVVIRDANHDHTVALSAMRFIAAPVVVGNDVWLAARATVLAGVTIGDGATIGAGSVVTRDVDAGSTVAGVPARAVRAADRGEPTG